MILNTRCDEEVNGTVVGRWVSVGERLPDSDGPVLVYTPKNKHAKVWIDCWQMQREAPLSWSSATIETGFMWDGFEFEDVTHWMPLPAAPVGGCTYPQCECEGPDGGGCGSAERPNVEFSGGAPLHGAASAGTKGYTSGEDNGD